MGKCTENINKFFMETLALQSSARYAWMPRSIRRSKCVFKLAHHLRWFSGHNNIKMLIWARDRCTMARLCCYESLLNIKRDIKIVYDRRLVRFIRPTLICFRMHLNRIFVSRFVSITLCGLLSQVLWTRRARCSFSWLAMFTPRGREASRGET
jgi:hypothetical protein